VKDSLDRYCARRNLQILRVLGAGKDGTVFQTSRLSAVKAHEREESYLSEREVYFRLRELELFEICALSIPILINHDDELRVLEMTVVNPPYILDFASAWLDKPPDFSREVINEWHDRLRESFGPRFPDIMSVLETLANEAGVFMLDIHPHNVKFEPDVLP
jgi:hypothetical protein